ncbi:MAG: hypothetical protein A2676_02875 [Candidatus Sungbacteria bacterium RIFCSPHIGHO2_01_FULL_51_22]|nr:MAG: hypothetical protein A2676_02875 [Candidatus Sungbacteria bacterium RIFCSPHIGHO2_01_FULL_51_22]
MKKSYMHIGHVGIVGAGMAGAVAAHNLVKAGFVVTVIEKEPQCGGRARSTLVNGALPFFQDHGGQFILDHYEDVMPLIKETGIADDMIEIEPYTATFRGDRFRRINRKNSGTVYSEELVSPRACSQVENAYRHMAQRVGGLDPNRYTAWYEFDNGSADWWFRRSYGEEGAAYLAEPVFNGLFFHAMQYAPEIYAAWMISHLARRDRWHIMRRGTQSIPEAGLRCVRDVRLNTPVLEIGIGAEGKALVRTADETLMLDAVIVTIPPPEAAGIISAPTVRQKLFLKNTHYWSTIVINLLLSSRLSDPNLNNATMAMIPAEERCFFHNCPAAFSLESGKHKAIGAQELLGTHLMSHSAERLMQEPDDIIAQAVIKDLAHFVPDMPHKLRDVHITRWPLAIPKRSPGELLELTRFWWDQEIQTSPIYIAGDSTSFPTFGGAAWSGKKASNIIAKRFCR